MTAADRDVLERAVAALVAELAARGVRPPYRAVGAVGGVAWGLTVVPAGEPPAKRTRPPAGVRAACKADVLAELRAHRGPLTLEALARRLKDRHGKGTVEKSLAELTKDGSLTNPRDKRGYRLPEWGSGPGGGTGSLFG